MKRRDLTRPLHCVGALACALALAACSAPQGGSSANSTSSPAVLNFSVLSAEDQASFEPLWTPMLNDLAKTIGRPVKPFFSSNYTALVQAMAFKQVQIGWFSAEPALEAINRADAEVFARTADLEGRETYNSVIIVKKGSGVTLDRILKCGRRLSFGMGDPKSTSGTLAPTAFLFQPHHLDPVKCFSVVRDATHAANLFSVANGVLDAATNNSVGLDFARVGAPQARQALDRLQVVWTSPPLPESALVYRRDLDPALRAKIADFFTHYGKAPGAEGQRQRAIMTKLHYTAFKPADDSYLTPIRQMEAATSHAK